MRVGDNDVCITEDEDAKRVTCRVAYADGGAEEQWVEFVSNPLGFGFSGSGDPWLTLLLPLAMTTGEDIAIEAPVSRTLFENAATLQDIWATWYGNLKRVEVRCPNLVEDAPAAAGAKGIFFSGGIDSNFSAIKLREQGEADFLLCLWGSDIGLDKASEFEAHRRNVEHLALVHGRPLVVLASNFRQTRFRAVPFGELGFGPALAAIGTTLQNDVSRLVLSDDRTYTDLSPWGGHPLTFPLFSTGRLACRMFGGAYERTERTRVVSENQEIMDALHVCWRHASSENCSSCEKCLRTLATLDALGRLDRAKSFDLAKYDLERVAAVRHAKPISMRYFLDIERLAERNGRGDLANALRRSRKRSEYLLKYGKYFDRIKSRASWKVGQALENVALRILGAG